VRACQQKKHATKKVFSARAKIPRFLLSKVLRPATQSEREKKGKDAVFIFSHYSRPAFMEDAAPAIMGGRQVLIKKKTFAEQDCTWKKPSEWPLPDARKDDNAIREFQKK
jgi:hypothetical protein